ncbi:MAG TPA: FAD-dependent oxidoreductase, partial [Lentisphaerae bacterium]|nr:FAD-dependent oxidoreductase [Lentisphaerota bacterium]
TWVARIVPGAPFSARFLRLACNITPGGTYVRQLLDELVVHTDPNDPVGGSCCHVTPLTLKRTLDLTLEEQGVPFLGGAPVCDVLRDADGNPAGVVLANRAGRQAVTARVVIDATEGAWPARCAGAVKTDFTPGDYSFSRIVIADATNAPSAPGLSVEALPSHTYPVTIGGVEAPAGMPTSVDGRVYRCSFTVPMQTGGMLELLEIEQTARDLTWTKTCLDQADRLSWLPPDHIVGVASEQATAWPGANALDLDAFRPQDVPYLYVLGVRADLPRSLAADLQHPVRMMSLADRIGAVAAVEALARAPLAGVSLPPDVGVVPGTEEVREALAGLPPVATNALGVVEEGERSLPVLATCGVLVVGAGTAGAPAAISAGRAGADTLVLDVLYTMGGVQTDGRIGAYYYGNACGFTANDVDPGWKATGAALYTAKAEWYRQACRAADVRVLYGTLANGAVVDGDAVKGVVVVLPDGQRGVIRAQTVIDSTGNADVAAAAGAQTEFITGSEPAVQGAGWARHVLGNSYLNNDIGFVGDADVTDVFFFARRARKSMPASTWDAAQNPATRERRRLVGAVTVTPIDILNNRTWPDTIVRPTSNFDSHGFTVHDLFFVYDPGTSSWTASLPFRALLPKTLDGLLVTGLGISAHRDAMPLLRMQRDVQNQGYAAGYAAALAVQAGVDVRSVDIAALQAHLVGVGIIDAAYANNTDSFPLSQDVIQLAVTGLVDNYATLPTVLADTATALPMLRTAYASAGSPADRLIYAHVLGLLGDPVGAQTLVDVVSSNPWDAGWNFRGMGQYGRSVSMMDSYLIALGRTLDPGGVSPLLAKAIQFNAASSFSHYRAVALASESFDSGSAAMRLAALLPLVQGYALPNAATAPLITDFSNAQADIERNHCLKELAVARALYRLGDDSEHNGEQVLTAYAHDPREVYAAHARQVLLADGPIKQTADGVWIGTAAEADWPTATNWQGGIRAGGVGAAAIITNDVATAQTISLQGGLQNIGTLSVAGAERTIESGVLDFSGSSPAVTVDDGSQVTLAADVVSVQTLTKTGDGGAVVTGAATLGGLAVQQGSLAFNDAAPRFFQAYAADPALHNTGAGGVSVSLRTDFQVNRLITVTHLGAYDSAGDGNGHFKKVAIFARTGGVPLAVTALGAAETYPLEGGYRFHRLPEPVALGPGEYALVTYGFREGDRYIEAGKEGVGEWAGTLNDGEGAISFLPGAYSTQGGALTFPTAALASQSESEYGVTAGSFRFAIGTTVKQVADPVRLAADATLDVGALDVRLNGGLQADGGGFGKVTNATAAYPVSLTLRVPTDETNTVPGTALGDRPDGPVTLVKTGDGRLDLQGPFSLAGGLHVGGGVVAADAVDAIGGGDLSFATGGRFEPRAGGTFGNMIYVPNQIYANDRSTRFVVPSGSTVTFTRGIETPRAHAFAGFVIQPHDDLSCFPDGRDDGVPLTVVNADGAYFGYVDLYLAGDALPGSGAALHRWSNVRGRLRKLSCGWDTADGCSVVFDEGCDFRADWLDIAGSNAVVSITNDAFVTVGNELRFVEGNATQLSLDGGRLRLPVLGVPNATDQHLSLRPLLFNGTVVEAARNTDFFIALSEASAAPLICNGGAIIDTLDYEVAIRGKGFAQAPDSTGALVKQGTGILKIAAPMTYTGPTLVSNGTLRLDFTLASPSNALVNLLAPESAVTVSAGAAFEVVGATNELGEVQHRQTLHRLVSEDAAGTNLRVTEADLAVNTLEGAWRKLGQGTFALTDCPENSTPFTGALTVSEGLFAVRGARTYVTVDVPYAGFESNPLLPEGGEQGAKDRRGAAATGCPGWTFNTDDAGYQRNGSYFAATALAYAPEGVQTAYVRRNGSIQVTLNFPVDGTYTLTFAYCPRYNAGIWYTNHVIYVQLAGAVCGSVTVTERGYLTATIPLVHVTAGTHILKFQGSTELIPQGDPCSLIDDIRISGVSEIAALQALSSDESSLTIETGARVELDYPGKFVVGDLVINGVRYVGGQYGALTHPEVFSGTGVVKSKSPGTLILLK